MTDEEHAAFAALVYADNGTEVACTRYLGHARDFLLPSSAIESRIYLENMNIYGRSDFYIVAKLLNDRRDEENFAFFYEAKAPQAYVMEFDEARTRCVPTRDLMKAENQLMHYVAEAAGSSEFLASHGIIDGRNVRAGGVIIGRRADRYLRGDDPQRSSARLAIRAIKLREEFFYKTTGMRVLTWDRILDYARPEPQAGATRSITGSRR